MIIITCTIMITSMILSIFYLRTKRIVMYKHTWRQSGQSHQFYFMGSLDTNGQF